MNYSLQIKALIGLLTAFIMLTIYIALTSQAPIWVETAQMLSKVSSLQFHVLVDIYILTLLFCIWMVKDSTNLGFSVSIQLLFVVMCVGLISIGVMSYLLYRALQLNKRMGN